MKQEILKLPNDFSEISAKNFLESMHLAKNKIYKILNNKDYILGQNNLEINLSQLPFITYKPYKYDLEILYEDDYFLIINKPKNYKVYPDSKEDNKTISNMVSYYYQKTKQYRSILYAHRIDIETSGVLVFAKDYVTLSYLTYHFANHTFKRIYLALVVGKIKNGVIDSNISRDRHNNKMICLKNNKYGKKSITYYKTIATNNNYNLVSFMLKNGRTHQIRVHLTTLNCHIYGDNLYTQINYKDYMMLHSYKFIFTHPYYNKTIEVTSKIPDRMYQKLKEVKINVRKNPEVNF